MDEVKKKPKAEKTAIPPDRVTLSPAISQKLNAWIDQLNDKFKGLIEINKSDLANYFLEKQPDVLNRDQIEKIKIAHYDEVRFMSWALQKMKESKKNGETLSLKDLMQLSQTKANDDIKSTKKVKSAESSRIASQIKPVESENTSHELPAKPDLV